jgi:hypothetical protein
MDRLKVSLVLLTVAFVPAVVAQDTTEQDRALCDSPKKTPSDQRTEEPVTPDPANSTRQLGVDELTDRQTIDAFTNLEDGQPGLPGQFQLQFDMSWDTTSGQSDTFELRPELQYTLDGDEFLRNMMLSLAIPAELGNGGVDGNLDAVFGWQQRWFREEGWIPTFSTFAEMRIPSGYQSSKVDGTFTAILAKEIGPGTAYLNGSLKTANGNNVQNVRHFQWGVAAGYQWRITEDLSLIGAYLHSSSEQRGHSNSNTLEISSRYDLTDQLSIGPGITIGLDDNEETVNFGAGVRVMYAF